MIDISIVFGLFFKQLILKKYIENVKQTVNLDFKMLLGCKKFKDGVRRVSMQTILRLALDPLTVGMGWWLKALRFEDTTQF